MVGGRSDGGVREVRVAREQAGQRLDNFLAAQFRKVPRSRLYRSVRTGEVRVNKGRARQGYRLREGDLVRLPPLDTRRTPAPARGLPASLGATLERSVLYEDADLAVLDKPAGLAVHGGSGDAWGLIEALRMLRPGQRFLELVHRLDRDTSGCLLLAKRRRVLVALHADLRAAAVDKRYLALLKGRWRGGGRKVEAALRRSVNRSGERVVRVSADGQPAETAFTPLAVADVASLVEARPRTGRTHQIRVHAAALGMPIAGDARYGDRDFNRELRARGLERLFLHASRLRFRHPGTDELLTVEAPLAADLRAVLEALALTPGPGRRARSRG